MSTALERLEALLQGALGDTVIGVQSMIHALTIAIVARGHVLVQGAPGLGKTLLSKTLAASLGGTFRRIQGTADLMPADIIGVHVYEGVAAHESGAGGNGGRDGAAGGFVFHPGPLFADVLLFDEINRAGPKTQSALLEAMEERQVSVERALYRLPAGFFVVATQNPRDFEGTYPLPESQLDRFMLRVELPYPQRDAELAVLARYGGVESAEHALGAAQPAIVAPALLEEARAQADAVRVSAALSGYILDLVRASREHSQITLGLSTRGALALLRTARVAAGVRGAAFVSPDDVKDVWSWVVPHRLVLSSEALLEGATEQSLARRLLEQVPVPR